MEQIIGAPNQTPSGLDQNTLIKDVTMKSFMADVIEASRQTPVLVDFWADWCGPCRQLTPLLEQAVKAAKGAVLLAKINADQNQGLCAQMQVQSLPTVIAFWQGQPIDGFQGALPASQIQRFIDQLKSQTGAGQDPLAEAIEAGEQLLADGQTEEALALFERINEAAPEPSAALVGQIEALLKLGEREKAQSQFDQLPEMITQDKSLSERLTRISAQLKLAKLGKSGVDLAQLEAQIAADPHNHDARYALAEAYLARGSLAEAGDSLLAIILRERDWADGKARALLLQSFEAAGPTDPFTLQYRRRLSSLLFS